MATQSQELPDTRRLRLEICCYIGNIPGEQSGGFAGYAGALPEGVLALDYRSSFAITEENRSRTAQRGHKSITRAALEMSQNCSCKSSCVCCKRNRMVVVSEISNKSVCLTAS